MGSLVNLHAAHLALDPLPPPTPPTVSTRGSRSWGGQWKGRRPRHPRRLTRRRRGWRAESRIYSGPNPETEGQDVGRFPGRLAVPKLGRERAGPERFFFFLFRFRKKTDLVFPGRKIGDQIGAGRFGVFASRDFGTRQLKGTDFDFFHSAARRCVGHEPGERGFRRSAALIWLVWASVVT